jgi:aryl-alcohol dehydrogenase-like predicted oxidoreductase
VTPIGLLPPHTAATETGTVCLGVCLGSRARTMTRGALAGFLDCALESGVRLLIGEGARDGAPPAVVGTALGRRRDEAAVVGFVGASDRLGPAEQCRAALRRAGLEHLDLCLLDGRPANAPIEECIGELGELVSAGLVAGLGVYGAEPEPLVRAAAEHPLSAAAVDYSLADRRAEAAVLPAAHNLGLPVLACRALANGVLAGRRAPHGPVLAGRLRAAQRIAAHEDLGTARLALAWLASRPGPLVPVVGCTDPIHLEYNLSALRTPLSRETLAALDAVFPAPSTGSGRQ